MILPDGTVVESGFASSIGKQLSIDQYTCYKLQVGQIVGFTPIDSDNSRSKKYNEFDVLVTEENSLMVYKNVRTDDRFGGTNDFNEVCYTIPPETESANTTEAQKFLGAQVLLLCMYGKKDQAVIITALQHSGIRTESDTTKAPEATGNGDSDSRDNALKDLPTKLSGAKEEDGKRMLGEFNGIRWNVNKDGEFTIMYQGLKNNEGTNTFTDTPTILKFNKNGDIFLLDSNDQEIKISHKDKKILISSGDGDKIEIDRTSHTINLEATDEVNVETQTGDINLNKIKGGEVLTTVTAPIVDTIFGTPHEGVPNVKAG